MKQVPLLSVKGLSVEFPGLPLQAVRRVSFDVHENECMGLVGESGSGKTVTALAILGLLDPSARITSGEIFFAGEDLRTLPETRRQKIRGHQLAMVFQEPLTAFNPVLSVGEQLSEPLLYHRGLSPWEARQEVLSLLEAVHMPRPRQVFQAFPHQLSGGMRQKAMIAMALSCKPKLLIADEPTSALDVTVQAEILSLLASLRRQFNLSVLLISHDLGIVSRHCSRVVVLRQGEIVEQGKTQTVFSKPRHPYTRALLEAVLR